MSQRGLLSTEDPEKINFIAAVSHEMRTPLSSVIGFAEVLKLQGEELSAGERQDLIEAILRNGQLLLRLVNDILDLSRMEASSLLLTENPVKITELLSGVQADLRSHALEKGVDLVFENSHEPVEILVDPLRLKQVLLNVIGNALKFTEQGCVRVSWGWQELERPHQRRLIFRVEDTGVGIPPENREKVFAPFQQVSSTWTASRGGSGLGLTIAKHLARLMGGDLHLISSQVGVGSVFEFSVVVSLSRP